MSMMPAEGMGLPVGKSLGLFDRLSTAVPSNFVMAGQSFRDARFLVKHQHT